MFAALPMYDRPANRAAHDAFWAAVRARLRAAGIDAPHSLDRRLSPAEGWKRADLLLGQICNLPLRMGMAGSAARLGACDYGVAGVPPGYYRSLFVVRRSDATSGLAPLDVTGRVLAISEVTSHSGWGAPWALARAAGRSWSRVLATGAHTASVAAVAVGRADIAAIDARTWQMLEEEGCPSAARLAVIGATDAAPGMTLITRHPDPAAIRAAVAGALAALNTGLRARLGLRGVVDLPDASYDLPMPDPPQEWAGA